MSEWRETTFGEFAAFKSGKAFPKDRRVADGKYRLLGANGEVGRVDETLHTGPFVTVGRVGAVGAVNRVGDEDCWVSDNALIVEPDGRGLITVDFLALALESVDYDSIRSGSSQPLITQTALKTVRFDLPTLDVQRRISHLFESVDAQIKRLETELLALRQLGRNVRQSALAEVSSSRPLGEVIVEIKRPVEVDPTRHYAQIGVRSHGRGVFTKEPVVGESLGKKKVFWVEPGDLVINIVFAWEGAATVIPDDVVGHCGSHRFPTYVRRDAGPIDYVRQFLLSDEGIAAMGSSSPGGAGRNRTLNRSRLLESEIPWPSIPRQIEIVDALSAIHATEEGLLNERVALSTLRERLLAGVLGQTVHIPESYDRVFEGAA